MSVQQLELVSGIYHVRRLKEEEACLYRAIRLEAIQSEPAMFSCTIPAEAELTDAEWLDRIKYPRTVFGLFANNELIGMTSILLLNDNEGYLGQSYIRKKFRGLGLSTFLYNVRLARASELQLKRLTVSHRESNSASKAAIQHFGFRYSYRDTCNWLDGTTADRLYYVLELSE